MATVVYQGFQSCLESQLNEPRALRLRLSSPNPHFFQPLELALKSCSLDSTAEDTGKRSNNCVRDNAVSPRPDCSSWSFLQALSYGSPLSSPNLEKERTYAQLSPSKTLSEKSLALCTENLGNETGSDITDNDVFSLASSDVETRNCQATETKTSSHQGSKSRKGNVIPSFPPPLTSMRGFECIQLRPHREDGRLVLKASKEPPRNTCFQAERSNGRLRLSILRDSDHIEDEEEEEEEETMELESEMHSAEYTEEEEEQQQQQQEQQRREEKQAMSVENHLQRQGRCVEGDRENRGLLNWEHLWVATS